jgi:hypothetical protein
MGKTELCFGSVLSAILSRSVGSRWRWFPLFYRCHDIKDSLTMVGGRTENKFYNCSLTNSYSFLNLSHKVLKGNSLNHALSVQSCAASMRLML